MTQDALRYIDEVDKLTYDSVMAKKSAESISLADNFRGSVRRYPEVRWLWGPLESVSITTHPVPVAYSTIAYFDRDIDTFYLATIWKGGEGNRAPSLEYFKGGSDPSFGGFLRMASSPAALWSVLSAYNAVDDTESLDRTFQVSIDAPLVTRQMLDSYYELRDNDTDSESSYVTILLLSFSAHGYDCLLNLTKRGNPGTYEVEVHVDRLVVFMPYDPGAVYSANKILTCVKSHILEEIDYPGASGTVTDSGVGSMRVKPYIPPGCAGCGTPMGDLKPHERLRVAVHLKCPSCLKMEKRLGNYRDEDGVIPDV